MRQLTCLTGTLLLSTLPLWTLAGDDAEMSCESTPALTRVCGLQNPEDMVHYAPTGQIIFGQFGSLAERAPGRLSAMAIDDLEVYDPVISTGGNFGSWGGANCKPLPLEQLSPHGLDLSRRADGSWQLLVVNHGGRESIEWFEVVSGADGISLVYRACAIAPEDGFFNDIAAVPGTGGFLVTQMYPRPEGILGELPLLKAIIGLDTGYLMRWTPDGGFEKVEGTDVAFANGVAISEDGSTVYMNEYFGAVQVYEASNFETLYTLPINHGDNLAWSDRGLLLNASHAGAFSESAKCMQESDYNCRDNFQIHSYDPVSRRLCLLMDYSDKQIPTATVALGVEDYLYLGTHSGDRITRVPWPGRLSCEVIDEVP